VINYSGGGPDDPVKKAAVDTVLQKGVVLVAAAGNSSNRPGGTAPVLFPAAYPGVIGVAATGPDDKVTFYSNAGPEISVAAPGGTALNVDNSATEILSTYWDPTTKLDGYYAMAGTSMASPHVAGAAALLLSEGAAPGEVKGLLERTAKDIEAAGKDNDTGYGLIDVYRALSEIGALIVFEKPEENASLGYIGPTVKARVANFDEGTLKLYADADPATDTNARPVDPGQYSYDTNTEELTFKTPFDTIGKHFVIIEATKGTKVKRRRLDFFLSAHMQTPGRTMFSVPYVLAQKRAEDLLGTTLFKMYRYINDPSDPSRSGYVKYIPGFTDPSDPASLTPMRRPGDPLASARIHGAMLSADVTTSPTMPVGPGYWLDLKTGVDIPLLVEGNPIEDQAYDLPLATGWNMIGDPFTFPVDWSNVQVEYQGQSATLTEAIGRGWITRTLYRYVNGTYQGFNAPEGQLMPWEAHWVHALVPCTLVVPPVPSTGVQRSTGTASRTANFASDSWKLQLSVRAANVSDLNNFIGVSRTAADGPDQEDMLKPPLLSPYVSLDFVRSDWGRAAGAYMEDIRSPVTSSKAWTFQVNTDMSHTDVVITWPNISRIPGRYRFTLEDLDTGRKVFMATQPSYTYNSGANPGARRFRITARLSAAESLMITNLKATPTRGQGMTLSYALSAEANVGVEVLTLTGKLIRQIPGGAQSSGLRSVIWDGRDSQGRSVPSGTYLMRVTASASDGQIARAVQPANVQ